MSAKLKILSGRDVIKEFERLGFQSVIQKGSHVKLRRLGPGGEKQTLVVPAHDELDAGTMRAIIRQASRYVDEERLKEIFYK